MQRSSCKQEKEHLNTLIDQRVLQHKPLQYILGTQPFCELDIVTKPPTLIPRWETEEWTDRLIKLLYPYLTAQNEKKMRILDICTGTGCIALALSSQLPKGSVEIIGLDISSRAIELANHNLIVHKHRLKNPVQFQQGDIFDNLPLSSSFHLVVSNPPYVTHDEYKSLDPDVKNWEDPRALVADNQGTCVHRRIIDVAKHNKPFASGLPRIVMEMGGTHQIDLLSRALDKNGYLDIQVWKDLAEKDRVIIAKAVPATMVAATTYTFMRLKAASIVSVSNPLTYIPSGEPTFDSANLDRIRDDWKHRNHGIGLRDVSRSGGGV
ncbi:hypothetical protein G6F22_009601 [Rhizopus arrhizus]|nr:hypothetical protein G6F23_010489 [Rhizopus arrhizus]KAG0781377.1 hypothetical protein G6F22_009601 [Rhizopus arrhizus]